MADYTPRSFGTHNGTFHADEVTACALLLLFDKIDTDKIYRTRDPSLLSNCEYVCDVGGVYDPDRKLFDHHQADYQGELSSAGMILLYLKERGWLEQKEYGYLNNLMIKGVDAHDNGKVVQMPGVATYSHIIANYTPVPYDAEEEKEQACFFDALEFAIGHLRRARERFRYIESCRKEVEEAMQGEDTCLMFEKRIRWMEPFFELGGEHHPAKFVIMPSGEHWNLRGIPPSYEDRMNVRVPFPAEWAGLLDEELKRVTGIEGSVFCHKGRFVSVWKTKEDALKALNEVLNLEEAT